MDNIKDRAEGIATQYTAALDFLRDQRRRVVPVDVTDAHEIPQADQRLAWLWLTHAQDHIAVRLDAYLRGGHTQGQEAGAVLKSIALGLEKASHSLFDAATRLKDKGDAHGASITHQASVEIHQLFEEISGLSPSEEADP